MTLPKEPRIEPVIELTDEEKKEQIKLAITDTYNLTDLEKIDEVTAAVEEVISRLTTETPVRYITELSGLDYIVLDTLKTQILCRVDNVDQGANTEAQANAIAGLLNKNWIDVNGLTEEDIRSMF